MIRILIAPWHIVVDPDYGSESAWAYNVALYLAKSHYREININAVCGIANNTNLPRNVRIFQTGFTKGGFQHRALFLLKCYNRTKELSRNVDIIHHMFPFGFRIGFNPFAIFKRLEDKSFIIGPIQYPQKYSDVYSYMHHYGKKGLETRLMFSLERIITKFSLRVMESLHENTLKEAEALVFDSQKTLKLYKEFYSDVMKRKHLRVIPPGVETESFRYTPPLKKKHFEILTVGYLVKRKGIQYLIRALPYILREFKDFKLRIVGDGPYKEELMYLVKKLSLSPYVKFEGKVRRNKLPEIYSHCDVYVQPSLSETFPYAIREAMSVGRPIVTTHVGFVDEHIKDGIHGYLVPPANSRALADAIIRLLSNEKLRYKMGLMARKYVEENLRWDKIASKWYELYAECTGR